MNERFQKLAEQARVECFKMGSKPGVTMGYDELEKFAELLLKDVAQFVEDKFDFCGDEIIIAEKIREHFGVEE